MTTNENHPARRRETRQLMHDTRYEVRGELDLELYMGPDPWRSSGLSLFYLATIVAVAAVSLIVFEHVGLGAGLASYPIVALLIIRSQRMLELLVHDGSHYLYHRIKWLNDLLCDVLAGAAVRQITSEYRRTHIIHHSQFGSNADPCRDRAAMAIMRSSKGRGVIAWMIGAVRALPGYLREYYGSVTSSSGWLPWLAFCAWHAAAIALLAVGVGLGEALALWAAYFGLPFFVLLPFLRMQAESDEHDYSKGCEAEGTYTNMGALNRWLCHPGGDAYHLAHHLFPSISISRLGPFDRAAREASVLYRSMPIRFR